MTVSFITEVTVVIATISYKSSALLTEKGGYLVRHPLRVQ